MDLLELGLLLPDHLVALRLTHWKNFVFFVAGYFTVKGMNFLYHSIVLEQKRCLLKEKNNILKERVSNLVVRLDHLQGMNNNLTTKILGTREMLEMLANQLMVIVENHALEQNEEFKESREENLRLKEKNHLLVELVACSICYTSNANCVLSPCGHSLCCFCFIQISKNWAKQIRFSHFSSTVGQGPCPFCRAIIMEVFQTKSHDVITFNVDSDDDTGGGGGGGCGGGGGGDGDNDDVDDVDGFDSSDGWQLMVIMMVLEDGW
eukprot:TRINITY_DN5337_c0_g1_i1.p1 TRINITY_DN5337_c0_g1~~TRINITY_DN5337_c0_g1_i1.p1  ORF type:complete len:263 (-),score=65.19 TRINITY_DN5337_c0_g1_i1:141-929(-)